MFGNLLTAMVTPFDNEGIISADVVTRLSQKLYVDGNDGIGGTVEIDESDGEDGKIKINFIMFTSSQVQFNFITPQIINIKID